MTRLSSIKTLNLEHEHLKMAQRWLDKLTTVMEKEKEEVRQCNNSRWSFHTRLSDKFTSSFRDITAVAAFRYNIAGLLGAPELTTKSTCEGSRNNQEISVDTWFSPSSKSSTKVNARENTDNRRPQHHAQPSHHVAFHHNGHYSSTSSQPNHYHFPAGMYQNGVPQHVDHRTWPLDPPQFINTPTHYAGHNPGHDATPDFIRWKHMQLHHGSNSFSICTGRKKFPRAVVCVTSLYQKTTSNLRPNHVRSYQCLTETSV
uniref:Uncharacterized protein n=1 Tax=Physcomitrium patens TaxID=3218 RepID=A0A2K1IV89_PHYPA|nr:hypothetical protein PHYPA_025137 [Physcomitrium patens]